MHLREQHAESLMELGEYIFQEPKPDDLCQYLATRICPSGELARVYVGRLDNDGVIRTAASFGYSVDSNVMQIVTPLEFDRPMPDAVRNKKLVVANREEILERYVNYEPLDLRSPWISTAVVPTLGNYVYVFRLQCRIDDQEFAEIYFKLVAALLNFYNFERANSKNSVTTQFNHRGIAVKTRAMRGAPLTERQELIVSLIQEGKTNGHISKLLGYSESLIRHETMIIYQKLGLSGRKELLPTVQAVSR
jgi:DNA-binding CsgD family transcriptional regulator